MPLPSASERIADCEMQTLRILKAVHVVESALIGHMDTDTPPDVVTQKAYIL